MRVQLVAFLVLFLVHGAIHLLGFAKAFALADVPQLKLPVGRTAGALWLLAALGIFAGAALLVLAPRYWAVVAAPAVLLSQVLIVRAWADAKAGTVANLV